MNEPKRCTRCVLSSAVPRITFDAQGVCSFCRDELFVTSAPERIEQAREEVRELFEKREKRRYDAVVCYSGGKDSTYTLMQAVRTYGLKVLSFTLDNGFLSPGAFQNIRVCTEALGVDHITLKASYPFMKELFKVTSTKPIFNPRTFVRISAGCNACISLVNMSALALALEKEIPFILAGFTLGQIPANSIIYKNNYEFLKESREGVVGRLKEHMGDIVEDWFLLPGSLVSRVKEYPHNINLLCLEEISEEEIVRAIEPLGWSSPGDVDGCSSNCRMNSYNNYVHQFIWGYNPYELELSHLVKKGHLTREEALEKIANQPVEQAREIMRVLGVEEAQLVEIKNEYIKSRQKKG